MNAYRYRPAHRYADEDPHSPFNFNALAIGVVDQRRRQALISPRHLHPPPIAHHQDTHDDPHQVHLPPIVASSEPPRISPLRSNRAPKLGERSCTIDEGVRQTKAVDFDIRLVPTVFKLYWPKSGLNAQPREVFVGGSFNKWQLVRMHGSAMATGRPRGGGVKEPSGPCCNWIIIIDLPEGQHQYKFKVDREWIHNPKEKTVPDGMGGYNNVVTVRKSDFEASKK